MRNPFRRTPRLEFSEPIAQVGNPLLLGLDQIVNALRITTVTRDEANEVAAVLGTRNRIVAGIGGLPLEQRNKNNEIVDSPFLRNPFGTSRTRRGGIVATVKDLYYDGRAYWEVMQRYRVDGQPVGFPAEVRYVPLEEIRVTSDGKSWEVERSNHVWERVDSNNIIEFEGMHEGILNAGGAKAIKDLIRLGRAAALFSDSPLPLGYFTTREPHLQDPEEGEILKFLRRFEAARRAGAYGFVPGALKLEVPSLDPEKLQLAETKREGIVDVARATSANLESLGISTTSRTYFNAEQVRMDERDFQLSLYTGPIEDRLSMPDVTPNGNHVRFNYEGFLRSDPLTRAQVYEIGLETGMFADEDEVREAEGKPRLTAAQKAARAAKETKAADRAARAARPAPTTPGARPGAPNERGGS